VIDPVCPQLEVKARLTIGASNGTLMGITSTFEIFILFSSWALFDRAQLHRFSN
jgi:hypothetical protein